MRAESSAASSADPLQGAALDGERLVGRTRLLVLVATAVIWPLSHLVAGHELGVRVAWVTSAAVVGVGLTLLMGRRLKARPPSRRFSMASVLLDVVVVIAILLSVAAKPFEGYQTVVLLSSTPALYVVVAASGVRFSRWAAVLGIVCGWVGAGVLVVIDAHLWDDGPYPATIGNLVGVGFNLFTASVVAWTVGGRTRALADGVRTLGRLAARTAHRLGSYVPPEVATASLLDGGMLREGRRVEVTVLFARLVTPSGAVSASERVAELNNYLGAMTEAIRVQGGVIDKYLADGVMVVFGVPREVEDPSARALGAAEGMERALEALNQRRAVEGRAALDHRIGIHRGSAVAGNVGTARRVSYTVVGDAVNVAARVQELAVERDVRIVATGVVRATLEDDVDSGQWQSLGPGALRGRHAPVELYRWSPRDVPSYPAPPSTIPPPRSVLPGSDARIAWKRASPQSRLALREAPGQLVEVVLTEARVKSERSLAWTRLIVASLAFVFAPAFVTGPRPEPVAFFVRVTAAVGIVASAWVLWRLRSGKPLGGIAAAGVVVFDCALVTAALAMFAVWPHPLYPGALRLPGMGLLNMAVILGGLRVRPTYALTAAVAGFVGLAVLLFVDWRFAGVVTDLPNIVTGCLVLGTSATLSYAIASRTAWLLTRTHTEALRAARARERLGAYVSEAVAAEAVGASSLELGGRSLDEVAVLFCDLRGFTRLSETLSPEEVVAQLNAYFDAMAVPIEEEHGVIDSFLGDAILVVFGAPQPRGELAARALRAAIGMRRALAAYREATGLELEHGIGLALGPAVAGHVGTPDRATFSVLGDVVGEAERLEGACKTRDACLVVSRALLEEARADDPTLLADVPGVPVEVDDPRGTIAAVAFEV